MKLPNYLYHAGNVLHDKPQQNGEGFHFTDDKYDLISAMKKLRTKKIIIQFPVCGILKPLIVDGDLDGWFGPTLAEMMLAKLDNRPMEEEFLPFNNPIQIEKFNLNVPESKRDELIDIKTSFDNSEDTFDKAWAIFEMTGYNAIYYDYAEGNSKAWLIGDIELLDYKHAKIVYDKDNPTIYESFTRKAVLEDIDKILTGKNTMNEAAVSSKNAKVIDAFDRAINSDSSKSVQEFIESPTFKEAKNIFKCMEYVDKQGSSEDGWDSEWRELKKRFEQAQDLYDELTKTMPGANWSKLPSGSKERSGAVDLWDSPQNEKLRKKAEKVLYPDSHSITWFDFDKRVSRKKKAVKESLNEEYETFSEYLVREYGIGYDDLTDDDYDLLYAEYEANKKQVERQKPGTISRKEDAVPASEWKGFDWDNMFKTANNLKKQFKSREPEDCDWIVDINEEFDWDNISSEEFHKLQMSFNEWYEKVEKLYGELDLEVFNELLDTYKYSYNESLKEGKNTVIRRKFNESVEDEKKDEEVSLVAGAEPFESEIPVLQDAVKDSEEKYDAFENAMEEVYDKADEVDLIGEDTAEIPEQEDFPEDYFEDNKIELDESLFLKEGADAEIYDDLYKYAKQHKSTSHWTKDNVSKKVDRMKRLWGDAMVQKQIDKVNKDYCKKEKVKTAPYSILSEAVATSTESMVADICGKLTNAFKRKEGTMQTWYEDEKDAAVQVLKQHYNVVDVSDGRRYDGEEMSWVIAYDEPKADEELTEGRKKVIDTENLWDEVYDELMKSIYPVPNRKLSKADFPEKIRFRFDADADGKKKGSGDRNAYITDDGFKLICDNKEQEKFAKAVADTYGCEYEQKGNVIIMHVDM